MSADNGPDIQRRWQGSPSMVCGPFLALLTHQMSGMKVIPMMVLVLWSPFSGEAVGPVVLSVLGPFSMASSSFS